MSFRRSLLLQRTRENFPSYFNPFAKTTFASSSPLTPASQSCSGDLRRSRRSQSQITIHNKKVHDHTLTADGVCANLADAYLQS